MTERPDDFRLDNPMLVRWEFASEERLTTRNAIYRKLIEGLNAEEVLFDAVAEVSPQHVLDVGCGAGEMAERIGRELGSEVIALDFSQRMVDLTRARGVEAVLGDVQALPFEDGRFDCVAAGWLLYHVADRDRAIAECARVLRPGGRFVTATLADENLADLWEYLGVPSERTLTFSTANGAQQVARHFAHVEVIEAEGAFVFTSPEEMRKFVASDMTRAHAAPNVPQFTEPVRVRSHHTVFVAEKAA
ncbi:MAG TPA: methyltransferase domain-containing protein [Gaiellaceae bacterium]|nr:methyltransferase domain-containing protein [Gaiellaceae bacterium]